MYKRKSSYNSGRSKTGSIDNQGTILDSWAEKNGYFIVASFQDIESGGSTKRAGLTAAIAFVGEKINNTSILVVYRVDRLYRDVLELLKTLKTLRKSECSFASVREQRMYVCVS